MAYKSEKKNHRGAMENSNHNPSSTCAHSSIHRTIISSFHLQTRLAYRVMLPHSAAVAISRITHVLIHSVVPFIQVTSPILSLPEKKTLHKS